MFNQQTESSSLLAAARTGSSAALGDLLESHRPLLLVLARQQLSDRLRVKGSASDVVQDTYADAVGHFDDFQGRSIEEFRSWIRCILEHNLSDLSRRYCTATKRNLACERPLAVEGADDRLKDGRTGPAELAERQEQAALLERALQLLSSEDRDLIVQHHRAGVSLPELSRRLGCTEAALRQRHLRAVARWREHARALGLGV
jgi:RNA polymerase sigma-70 factor (ECF subfamily)